MAAPPSKAAAPSNPGQPNQSLYIKNLNDKINTDDLKRQLYILFTTFGPVLDIVCHKKGAKGQSMRGQAHICFKDIQTATQAMRQLQDFEFLGKELKISYAKGTSNIIPKLRGTFEAPAEVGGGQATEAQKSVFDAPPGAKQTDKAGEQGANGVVAVGQKRPREEDEDDNQSVEMQEDDDDAPMDEDDDD